VYTAFSRQVPGQKVYVQHHLTEHSAEVRSLLCEKSGYLYVCGAARMAREVQQTLAEILGVSGLDGDEAVRRLKAEARFQVCVTKSSTSH
jgi:sulfite reductase alpha subunit-like flavoprotein